METPRDELEQENKQQIVQLIRGMANISMSDERDEGMFSLSAFRSREEELTKKIMEVREKVEAHLRRVVEDAMQLGEICKEQEGLADSMSREVVVSVCDKIDWANSEYKSLAWSSLKKGKKYKEALEALESFNELKEVEAEPHSKLLEIVSESLEAEQGKNEVIEEEEKELISSNSKVENEKQIEIEYRFC